MLRLSTARATVLGSVIAVLCLTLNACSDSTGLAPDGTPDATLRRGVDRPGNSGWKTSATSLEVAPDGFSIVVGATSQLSVTARNRQGTEVPLGTVTWRSSDTTVARVADGAVTARKTGTALISATLGGLADTVTASVSSVALAVDSIAISPASANLIVGQQLNLTAEPLTAEGVALTGTQVTWASSSTSIATVTSSGEVTGVRAGNAVIKASAGGTSSDMALAIQPVPVVAVASVVLAPSPIAVTAGQTVQLSATTKAADGSTLSSRALTWASSNAKVATVSSSGLLTGVGAGTAAISAMSEGQADTASAEVAPSIVPVASVVMNDGADTLAVSESKQLVATPKDAQGNALTGRTITWASSRTGVATVSTSGLVKAIAAGSATITATVEGKAATSAIVVEAAVAPSPDPTPDPTPSPGPVVEHSGFFVAPNGTAGASGTKASPWDLNSALSGNKSVPAGDTVWVRGGTYRGQFYSYINGSPSAPVVIRQYPGERGTIDGNLVVVGSHVVFWGLEVMNSNPLGVYRLGVNNRGPDNRFINMVVHDAGASGIYLGIEGPGSGVYGSIVYNNGTNTNQDHGIYANNNAPVSAIEDNIIFNNQAYGLHGYSSIGNYINNFLVRGNASFNNGLITNLGGRPDLFIGGTSATGIDVEQNYTYRNDGGQTLAMGLGSATNGTLTLRDNYLVGTTAFTTWASITQSGNTTVSLSAKPSGTRVFVRPNRYEAGRANVIVYNWSNAGSVSVDLSGVIRAGDTYEVRNAQNFYGSPVATGTYGGGSVSIPISGITAVRPLGRTSNALSTGTQFGVFVVLKTN